MRVLIVEDNPLIAMDLTAKVHDAGLIPLGPARDTDSALCLADTPDVAVAIVDLGLEDGDSGAFICRCLAARGIQTVVYSGRDRDVELLADIPHIYVSKDIGSAAITDVLESAYASRFASVPAASAAGEIASVST